MSALLGLVQIKRLDVAQADYGLRCFSYMRDHLEIMRNCLPALDAGASWAISATCVNRGAGAVEFNTCP